MHKGIFNRLHENLSLGDYLSKLYVIGNCRNYGILWVIHKADVKFEKGILSELTCRITSLATVSFWVLNKHGITGYKKCFGPIIW